MVCKGLRKAKPNKVHIITLYVPTSEAEEICDWNAKIINITYEGYVSTYALGEQNNREERLLQMIIIILTNTIFKNHLRRLLFERSIDGKYKNQIDYIVVIRWNYRNSRLYTVTFAIQCLQLI